MNANKSFPTFYWIFTAIAIIVSFFIFHAPISPKESIHADRPLPEFTLPNLFDAEKYLTQQTLQGQVFLLNIWGSWCNACQAEHAILLMIKNNYHIPIYGIDYQDQPADAQNWLQTAGNPYTFIAVDLQGELGNILQLYGTPTTFIVDKKGRIRYQYVGAMTEADWQHILLPQIHAYEAESVI